jgi:hypothetical protein
MRRWIQNVVGDHLVPWDFKDGDRDTPNDGKVAMVHNGFRKIYKDRVKSTNPDVADLPTPSKVTARPEYFVRMSWHEINRHV